jgi:hypothetical protein
MIEASDVADFDDEADGRDKRGAAQGLKGVDDECPTPAGDELPQLLGDPQHPSLRLVDRVAVLLQRHVLRRRRDT